MILFLNTKEISIVKDALHLYLTHNKTHPNLTRAVDVLERVNECEVRQKPTCKVTITVETSE